MNFRLVNTVKWGEPGKSNLNNGAAENWAYAEGTGQQKAWLKLQESMKGRREAKHPATKWAATEKLMASVWGMQQERRQLRWEEMRAMPGRNYLNPAILSGSWSICPLNPESPSHTSPNYRMPTADTRRTKSCQRKQKKTRNWTNKEWHNLVNYNRLYGYHLSRQGRKICWSGQLAIN